MRLHCNECGKSVSNEVPEETVLRAWATCPECVEELMLSEKQALELARKHKPPHLFPSSYNNVLDFIKWLYKEKISIVKDHKKGGK